MILWFYRACKGKQMQYIRAYKHVDAFKGADVDFTIQFNSNSTSKLFKREKYKSV